MPRVALSEHGTGPTLKGCRKDKPSLVVHNAMLQCSEIFALLLESVELIPASIEQTYNNFSRPTQAAFTL